MESFLPHWQHLILDNGQVESTREKKNYYKKWTIVYPQPQTQYATSYAKIGKSNKIKLKRQSLSVEFDKTCLAIYDMRERKLRVNQLTIAKNWSCYPSNIFFFYDVPEW